MVATWVVVVIMFAACSLFESCICDIARRVAFINLTINVTPSHVARQCVVGIVLGVLVRSCCRDADRHITT